MQTVSRVGGDPSLFPSSSMAASTLYVERLTRSPGVGILRLGEVSTLVGENFSNATLAKTIPAQRWRRRLSEGRSLPGIG